MLGTLQLEGFRGFETYALSDLTRVNLLVGKNNCGKTSILEAVHFLVSGGDPLVLTRTAKRRGEVSDTGATSGRGWQPDISHFFFGHRFGPGTNFSLSGDGHGKISVKVRFADVDDRDRYLDLADDMEQSFSLVLQIEGGALKNLPILPLTENGSLVESRVRFRTKRRSLLPTAALEPATGSLDAASVPPPVQLVTPDSLELDPMRVMWDRVLTEDRESEVVDAMKLLDDDLKSIRFLTSDASRTRSNRAGVLLGFQGGGHRVPLGSYGDGMRRLLALSLSLIHTANGVLLIDEIDTGLHWTVMEDMWRLVVDTARKSSVQVFATTHSYDCIRGLAALAESHSDLVRDVSIHKMERALHKAVRFAEEDIPAIVDQNIEVR